MGTKYLQILKSYLRVNRYAISQNRYCLWDKNREKLNYNRLFKIKIFVQANFVFSFHRKKEQTYTLAYCNSKIKDATQFLLDKNMTQAYLSLAEVLKKVHMSEEHKELQQQALDIVITSLGKSPYQSKLMFHSKGRFGKLY